MSPDSASVALRISSRARHPHMLAMHWKTVRLELAPTAKFPRGSAGRAFLMNVPIDKNGCIDRAAVENDPARATVRRYWASEPDSFGLIEAFEGSWALQCRPNGRNAETFLLEGTPLSLNARVNVRNAEGTELPFRVASIRSLGARPRVP
jgi:hypothetical protein